MAPLQRPQRSWVYSGSAAGQLEQLVGILEMLALAWAKSWYNGDGRKTGPGPPDSCANTAARSGVIQKVLHLALSVPPEIGPKEVAITASLARPLGLSHQERHPGEVL